MGRTHLTIAALSLALAGFVSHEARSERRARTDLGTVGPTWPIQEADLLQSLIERARAQQRDGGSATVSRALEQGARTYASTPPSLGLPRARRNRSHAIDPTIALASDVADSAGRLIAAAGTRLNPLEHMRFGGVLVFVDAADERQMSWARTHFAGEGRELGNRLILTGGSPGSVAKELNRPVFFDQNAQLVRRFGIDAVPAMVAADPSAPHTRLLVREVALIEGKP